MKIEVNGEAKEFPDGVTLLGVMKKLGVEEIVMAAAVNLRIVKKEEWGEFLLSEGDRVELLHFVGGG